MSPRRNLSAGPSPPPVDPDATRRTVPPRRLAHQPSSSAASALTELARRPTRVRGAEATDGSLRSRSHLPTACRIAGPGTGGQRITEPACGRLPPDVCVLRCRAVEHYLTGEVADKLGVMPTSAARLLEAWLCGHTCSGSRTCLLRLPPATYAHHAHASREDLRHARA
jgi:hypothetical protein